MQLYSIASGSSGNCIYLGEEDGGILIDAGISRKRIVTGLERKGLSLDDIKAIFSPKPSTIGRSNRSAKACSAKKSHSCLCYGRHSFCYLGKDQYE